jgi:hypothetical protein
LDTAGVLQAWRKRSQSARVLAKARTPLVPVSRRWRRAPSSGAGPAAAIWGWRASTQWAAVPVSSVLKETDGIPEGLSMTRSSSFSKRTLGSNISTRPNGGCNS